MYPHAHSIPSHRSLPTHSSIPALKDTKTSVYMPNNKVTADTYTQLCHLWVMVVDLTRTHALRNEKQNVAKSSQLFQILISHHLVTLQFPRAVSVIPILF